MLRIPLARPLDLLGAAATARVCATALHGVAHSRRLAGDCVVRAKATLEAAGLGGRLTELADWSLTRTK